MRKKTKTKRVYMAALALILILCSCSSQQQGAAPSATAQPSAAEGSLSVGVYNFDTYNPIATQSQSVTQVSALIYDGLMSKKGDYTMVPVPCSKLQRVRQRAGLYL